MNLRTVAIAVPILLLLAGCRQVEEAASSVKPVKAEQTATSLPDDSENLFNLPHGVVVTHRSGEMSLDSSAIQAVDSNTLSMWITPPDTVEASMTFELPAKCRIDHVGLSTPFGSPAASARTIRYEWSEDGKDFHPLTTVRLEKPGPNQLFTAGPVEARFIRATTVETAGSTRQAAVALLEGRGQPLEPPAIGAVDGTWKLNNDSGSFGSTGNRIAGTVRTTAGEMHLDGGLDGEMIRFVWMRGAEYGCGAMTVTPDSSTLNAVWWFRLWPAPLFAGPSWFGRKEGSASVAPDSRLADEFLRRLGSYRLYGLHFENDGSLDSHANAAGLAFTAALIARYRTKSPRIVIHEFHQATAAENLRLAEKEVAALREALAAHGIDLSVVQFVPAGSTKDLGPPESWIARLMESRADLEIAR
ncbi:MAG: hypothetical protein WBX15_02415 [Thermoanaerobaculia bacterium]